MIRPAAERFFPAMIALAILPGFANTSVAQQAQPAGECFLRTPPQRQAIKAVVLGFLTPEQAQAAIIRTQQNARGTIDPAYTSQLRARLRVEQTGRLAIALVPAGMDVHAGQRVTFTTAHRNPALPCHYIPNLIINPLVS